MLSRELQGFALDLGAEYPEAEQSARRKDRQGAERLKTPEGLPGENLQNRPHCLVFVSWTQTSIV